MKFGLYFFLIVFPPESQKTYKWNHVLSSNDSCLEQLHDGIFQERVMVVVVVVVDEIFILEQHKLVADLLLWMIKVSFSSSCSFCRSWNVYKY